MPYVYVSDAVNQITLFMCKTEIYMLIRKILQKSTQSYNLT